MTGASQEKGTRTSSHSSNGGSSNGDVFPPIDARFQRFTNFRQESSTAATIVYGHAGKPKVLKYCITTLVKRGAFLTALASKGTIFTMDQAVWHALALYFCISAACSAAAYFFSNVAEFDYTKLESVSNYLNMFIPFILGLYVSLALSRWWTLRTDGIGKVLDATTNLTLINTTLFPGPEWQPWHDQVLKYALASISLIVQTVRNKENVEHLGPNEEKLLTDEEVKILADMPIRPRPAVMWSWISALCTKVAEEQGVPPGKHRDIVAQCVSARDGISLIWTYLGTQLPFAYVHLVTFLVNLNNLVMAVKCGVVFAASVQNRNWIHAMSQLVFIFVVPLLYQGLLSVSYVIHDPFGEDLLDFPVMAFQEYTNEASCALMHYTCRCPALSQDFGPPPTTRDLCLRKGMGREVAEREAAAAQAEQQAKIANGKLPPVVQDSGVEDTDGDVLETPLIASLREQARVKEELITSLKEQNQLLESGIHTVGSRLRQLEAQMSRAVLPPPPPPSDSRGWCAAPQHGTDRIVAAFPPRV